jgi:hypothetical protein
MDSILALDDTCRDDTSSARTARRLAGFAAAALFASVAIAGLIFLVRRIAGGTIVPLSDAAIVLSGVMLAATAAILRLTCEPLLWRVSPLKRRVVSELAPTCLVLLIAAVLSLPGSSMGGLIGLWSFVVAGVATIHGHGFARRTQISSARCVTDDPTPTNQRVVWQRFTRLCEADGTEVVEGWLRADLPAGARTKQIHIAFCPPFLRNPDVEAEPESGPAMALKIGPVFPHGAQIEIRLDRPLNQGASVAVAIAARATAE